MNRTRGFTLIELAIVLVIMTILIGGLAVPLSAQIQARRIAETQKTLEEAKEAIVGYAMTHKTTGANPRPYLPCPDIDGDGREDRVSDPGPCARSDGYFPWVDLGAAAQDPWGNRLGYVVELNVSDSTVGFFSYPAIPANNWKQVASSEGCAVINVAANLPYLLISHGPNGWGARNVNGNTLAAPTGADEIENLVDDPATQDDDACYVSRTPSKPGETGSEFDDIVAWLPLGSLISRVCPTAGGCP
jgi:prepilin-type N-terminal cleavage/methylation domain-containing protein